MTFKDNIDSIWIIEHYDPKVRFEMTGEPVRVDDQILLKHSHTANWLGSENNVVKNIYGAEMEVFVHSYCFLPNKICLQSKSTIFRVIRSNFSQK